MSRHKRGSWLFWLGVGAGAYAITRLVSNQHLESQADYFQGKVVLITGASRGVGRALAHAFAARGASPVLAARSEDRLREVAAECKALNTGVGVLVVPTDVTDEAQLERLVEAALDHFGHIDILVNNAGIVQGGLFVEADPCAVRCQIEVNLLAAMRLTQIALPPMIERGQGQVINISSVMGRHAVPYMTAYSVSKHGLVGFGAGLRRELAATGVRVLTVCLGFTDTAMVSEESRAMLRPFGVRILAPEYVAERILDAIVLGLIEVNIGGVEFLTEWINRFSPWLADFMWRRFMPPEFAQIAAQQRTE
jgi:short-subunit dehydrogenase